MLSEKNEERIEQEETTNERQEYDYRQIIIDNPHLLTPREEKVVVLHMGLNGDEPKTLEELGEDLGCAPDRVRQILSKALKKLRHPSNVNMSEKKIRIKKKLEDFVAELKNMEKHYKHYLYEDKSRNAAHLNYEEYVEMCLNTRSMSRKHIFYNDSTRDMIVEFSKNRLNFLKEKLAFITELIANFQIKISQFDMINPNDYFSLSTSIDIAALSLDMDTDLTYDF